MEKSVEMTLENGVASIFFNEPNSLNALSKKLKDDLKGALDLIEQEPNVKVVIFAGKGRTFCAGGDVKAMQAEYDPIEVKKGMEVSSTIIERIRDLRKITISAVQGYAAGAGMSLAIASDIVIAEENAKFVLSFKNVGLIPDLGLHYHLPRMVGEWKAKEWIWSGKKLTAQEACEIGFVHEVVTEGSLIEKANEIANELMNGPIQSFILSKLLINRYQNASFTEILEKEVDTQTIIKGGSEHKDAVAAFFSKK